MWDMAWRIPRFDDDDDDDDAGGVYWTRIRT